MPLLFLERFPWPSLQTYTILSVVLLAGSIFSAYNIVTDPGFGPLEADETPSSPEVDLDHLNNDISNSELATTVLWYLATDSLFVWVSVALLWSLLVIKLGVYNKCQYLPFTPGVGQHILLLVDVNSKNDSVCGVWST